MKNLLFSLIVIILLSSCATINELSKEAIHHAIVGQNMKVVGDRLGLPTKITSAPNGEKIMLYEYHSRGIANYPNQSNISESHIENPVRGSIFGINPYANANSMIYENNYTTYKIWLFEVFINAQGYCYKIQQNLTPEQMEEYYARFKHYIPKE